MEDIVMEDMSVGLPSGYKGQLSIKRKKEKIKQHTQVSPCTEHNYFVEAQPTPRQRISWPRSGEEQSKPYFLNKKALFKYCWRPERK